MAWSSALLRPPFLPAFCGWWFVVVFFRSTVSAPTCWSRGGMVCRYGVVWSSGDGGVGRFLRRFGSGQCFRRGYGFLFAYGGWVAGCGRCEGLVQIGWGVVLMVSMLLEDADDVLWILILSLLMVSKSAEIC
ncbi:hypothetical protein A2U01_0026611, partial [Trifolium medium]|nr:hypothetical protein [Trifolium medium]